MELEILATTNHVRETVTYDSCTIQSYIHNIKYGNHEQTPSLFLAEGQRELSHTLG